MQLFSICGAKNYQNESTAIEPKVYFKYYNVLELLHLIKNNLQYVYLHCINYYIQVSI